MKKALSSMFIMLLLFCGIQAFAQSEDEACEEPSKKARKEFENATKYNFQGPAAYESLLKAVEIDPTYAAAYSALAYVNYLEGKSGLTSASVSAYNKTLQAQSRAQKYWKLTIENCPSYRNFEAYYLLGITYYQNGNSEEAESYLKSYLNNANHIKNADYEKAKEMLFIIRSKNNREKRKKEVRDSLLSHKVPFDPIKVKGASTSNDEYLPVLSPDNQYLFYTRREWVDTRSYRGKEEMERFIQSNNNYNFSFTEGQPMPKPFNRGGRQGGVSVSVDNKLIFVTVIDVVPRNGTFFSNGDIYYSEWQDTAWSPLKSIGDNINNDKTWEGQPSISADNKVLFFASAREPDGVNNYGGMDLYKSIRQEDGSWGDPINLGPKINTAGNEKTPFLHSDSYTLYFSSDEHPGVGGFDIFYVKMDKDGVLGRPNNIGYPINTENDEHGFVVSTDGKYGYFSSNLEGNNLDIYSFVIPEEARPEDVMFVRGKIISGLEASKGLEITLKNTSTSKEVNAVIDEKTGEYVGVIAVKKGEDAIMTAKKEGYAFSSQYISSTENIVGKPIETKMAVEKIKVGQTYKINNINFATNSYELNSQAQTILAEFKEFLDTNPTVKVKIQGHTDNVGKAADNLVLSNNRAKSVYEYLILEGIAADRLSYEGFGQNNPVKTNETAEGRAENRRTEFLIISL